MFELSLKSIKFFNPAFYILENSETNTSVVNYLHLAVSFFVVSSQTVVWVYKFYMIYLVAHGAGG
jgi:hypothetical protein